MITINTISPTRFSFNGVTYHKNFMPFVTGNKIAIINVYDGCITLTDAPTIFSDYTVNGVTYSSVNDLQSALLDVIYTRNSLTNAAITLTTIGNSGAATLTGITLNIPNYIGGTGTTNFLPKFTGASTLGNSSIFDNGTNVGIGTTDISPDFLRLERNQNANTSLRVRNSDAGSSAFAMLSLNASGNAWGIRMGSSAANSNALDFLIDAYGTPTSVMRLTPSGNVGIGTTSPEVRFDVLGAGTVQSRVQSTSGGDIRFSVDTVGRFGTYSASDLLILTSGSERMRIASDGNVSIGTTNTGYGKLAVYDASNSLFSIANSTSYATLQQNGSDLYFNTNLGGAAGGNLIFRFGASATERIRFTNDGNVGIGTTSPVNLLQVSRNATSDTAIVVSNTGTSSSTTTMSFVLQELDVPNGWFRRYRDGSAITEIGFSNDFVFAGNIQSSKSERMRITSGGNVGIGTTWPTQRLDVNGLINSTNGICVGGEGVSRFWTGTQAAYDAITTKVSTTVYLIT
jgi:hypothetical protein